MPKLGESPMTTALVELKEAIEGLTTAVENLDSRMSDMEAFSGEVETLSKELSYLAYYLPNIVQQAKGPTCQKSPVKSR